MIVPARVWCLAFPPFIQSAGTMRHASIDDTVACCRWASILDISSMWITDGHLLGIQTLRWCLCMMTNKCSKQVDARLARKYGERVMATHESKTRRLPADDLLQLMLDLDCNCFSAQNWPQILAQLRINSAPNIDDEESEEQLVRQHSQPVLQDSQDALADSPGSVPGLPIFIV